MTTFLLILSAIFTLICAVPYIIDIVRRKTKPRIVSWFNWTLLTGIATVAAISEQHWASAVLTGAATIETLVIVILAVKYGDKKIERFDVFCQIGAIVGLLLWWVFDDPAIAIIATVAVDFLAGLPTFKHSWLKPGEETRSTFALAALGSLCALLATDSFDVSALAYPIYILLGNLLLVIFISKSPHRSH
jgi:hypothetical protein